MAMQIVLTTTFILFSCRSELNTKTYSNESHESPDSILGNSPGKQIRPEPEDGNKETDSVEKMVVSISSKQNPDKSFTFRWATPAQGSGLFQIGFDEPKLDENSMFTRETFYRSPTGLADGKYSFKLRAQLQDKTWSPIQEIHVDIDFAPPSDAASAEVSKVGEDFISLSWQAPAEEGAKFILLMADDADAANPQISSGTQYPLNTEIGDYVVILNGSQTEITVDGLIRSKIYKFLLYSYDSKANYSPPKVFTVAPKTNFVQVDGGTNYTCALTENGELYCSGEWVVPFNGAEPNVFTKALLPDGETAAPTYAYLSAGDNHACVLDDGGAIYCWGYSETGMFDSSKSLLQKIDYNGNGFSGVWVKLTVGDYFTCGIDSNAKAFCWGRGDFGISGDGNLADSSDRLVPTPVADPAGFSGKWVHISSGHVHSCGIDDSGQGFCWGYGTSNALGINDNSGHHATPQQITSPAEFSGKWIDLSASVHYSCGIDDGGTLYCWGQDQGGTLGLDDLWGDYAIPTAVLSDRKYKSLGAHGETYHICATNTEDQLECWGDKGNGALALPASVTNNNIPQITSFNKKVITHNIGEYHTCLIDINQDIYCTGYNSDGQLGLGHKEFTEFFQKALVP